MLSNEHDAKASQAKVAEVQEELRKVVGGGVTLMGEPPMNGWSQIANKAAKKAPTKSEIFNNIAE